jgi:hypothetical protein
MKDFWKRVYLLYPKACNEAEVYIEAHLDYVRPNFMFIMLPHAMHVGILLQFVQDNEWVRPSEIESELFATSGDFIDNAQQFIEKFLETLENRL